MDINQKIFIVIIVILTLYLIYIQFYSAVERFTNTATSNEALQTISSVFNNQNMSLGNLITTGNIFSSGPITSQGDIKSSGNIITTGSGAGFTFTDRTGSPLWQWYGNNGTANLWNGSGNIFTIDKSGNTNITGNLTVGGMQWKPSPHQIQSIKQKAANKCLSASGDLKLTVNETCNSNDPNQYWYWMGDNLVNWGKQLCISMPNDNNAANMKLDKCDSNDSRQLLYRPRGPGTNGINNISTGKQLFFNPNDSNAQIADGWSCNTDNNSGYTDGHDFCQLSYGKPS